MKRIIDCHRFHGKESCTLLQTYAGGIFCCQTTVGHEYCVGVLIVHSVVLDCLVTFGCTVIVGEGWLETRVVWGKMEQ